MKFQKPKREKLIERTNFERTMSDLSQVKKTELAEKIKKKLKKDKD